MKVLRMIIALLLTLISFENFGAENRIHSMGYGPVKVGMSVAQASRLLGTSFAKTSVLRDVNVDILYPTHGNKGLNLYVSDGLIELTYLSYDAKNIKTDKGIRI